MKEIQLELFADYFQFYLQDEKASGDIRDIWTQEAVDNLLALTEGVIAVGTARNMDVPVTIKIYENEPNLFADNQNEIGQINECDLNIISGNMVVSGCTDYFPDAKRIGVPKGLYRTRIYYRNLDKLSEDGLDGEDFYELHLWPTDKKEGMKVIKHKNNKL